jgi:hypothetical protein
MCSMSSNYYFIQEHHCSAFIVVLPVGAAFDQFSMQIRIEAALAERFPPYMFAVTNEDPDRCETFKLAPILGAIAEGKPRFHPPSVAVVREIGIFLYETFIRDMHPQRAETVH